MPRRFFHAQKEVTKVPNEENLIPVRSERKRAKGGKAIGEARRKKKELRETMEALLQAAAFDRTFCTEGLDRGDGL